MEDEKIRFILELSRDVENVRQRELNKLPYEFNVLDSFQLNENCNTKILLDLLRFKDDGNPVFLKSFVSRMNLRYGGNPLPESEMRDTYIPFNSEFIDGLVEDKERRFGIIIENKIHYAVDQDRQIERYIDSVKNHGVDEKSIYVIYLTRDGSKVVSSASLTKRARRELCCTEDDNGRFIEMNYRDDILPWLREDVLSNIKVKDVLLLSTVNLYIDYLEGLMHTRKSDEPISKIMKKEIERRLELKDKSDTESWKVLEDNYKNLETLKTEIANMKSEIEQKVADSWCDLCSAYFGEWRNSLNNGFFQLFLGSGIPHGLHFEWMFHKNDLFESPKLYFALHGEGKENKYVEQLLRNDALRNEAELQGFSFGNRNTVIYKNVELPGRKSFSELSDKERDDFMRDFSLEISKIAEILKASYNLIENDVQITKALCEKMFKKTQVKWAMWPEPNAWDLVKDFNNKSHRIGIESSFAVNALMKPEYRIYITVWDRRNWNPYEDALKEEFPDAFSYRLDKEHGNRVFLHLPPVTCEGRLEEQTDIIADELKAVYDKMLRITSEIK